MIKYWPSLVTNSLRGLIYDPIVKNDSIMYVIELEDIT